MNNASALNPGFGSALRPTVPPSPRVSEYRPVPGSHSTQTSTYEPLAFGTGTLDSRDFSKSSRRNRGKSITGLAGAGKLVACAFVVAAIAPLLRILTGVAAFSVVAAAAMLLVVVILVWAGRRLTT